MRGRVQVMLDAGTGRRAQGAADAWLVTDERSELRSRLRRRRSLGPARRRLDALVEQGG